MRTARLTASGSAFALAIFSAAFLLFWFEPMYAKRLLPLFGGSASVWNVTLFFYQAVLLVSYIYVHLTTVLLPLKRQVQLHLVLVAIALAFIPVGTPASLTTTDYQAPYLTLFRVLVLEIGPVFFIVACTSPLLQRWYSLVRSGPDDSPYRLYAVSNAGSLLGLLGYPFFFESRFSIATQNTTWSIFFLVLACTLGWLGFKAIRTNSIPVPEGKPAPTVKPQSISYRQRGLWFLLSAVPSALLLAVTLHLTTDIAAAPFIWVLPLAVYLITFVFTYAGLQIIKPSWMLELHTWCLIALAVYFFIDDVWWLFALHLAGLFATCMVCHGRLSAEAPDARHLTEYYFWLALGGACGGFFASIIAPNVFNTVVEYPLLLVAAAFLRPSEPIEGAHPWQKTAALLAGFLLLVFSPILLGMLGMTVSGTSFGAIYLFALALALLSMHRNTLRFGLATSVLFLAFVWDRDTLGEQHFRSFHGVYKVSDTLDGKLRLLFSGTTIHGSQARIPALRREPLTYYNRAGPLGQVAESLSESKPDARVMTIGLGAGAVTCLLPESMQQTFIEIDPLIIEIASDPDIFSYVRDCGANTEILLGDGRIVLSRMPPRSFDLIVVDAFSSDSIPVHLLTREALEIYAGKLQSDGILLLHLSNRFIDLIPVVGALADELGMPALLQDYEPDRAAEIRGGFASTWVILAKTEGRLKALQLSANWQALRSGKTLPPWTDDHSDVFSQVLWRKLLWGTPAEQQSPGPE